MAEVSENTRVVVKAGSVIGIVLAVLLVGKYWGTFETQRETTADSIARHEQAIGELRGGMAEMKASIDKMGAEQANFRETMATVNRNTQALLYETSNIKVALAERGFRIPKE